MTPLFPASHLLVSVIALDLHFGRTLAAGQAGTGDQLLHVHDNAVAVLTSFAGGHLADRTSPRRTFTTDAAVQVSAFVPSAASPTTWPALTFEFALPVPGSGRSRPLSPPPWPPAARPAAG